jgi:hypothetical protein
MAETSGTVGACPECGRRMRVMEIDRVADTDRTRIRGAVRGGEECGTSPSWCCASRATLVMSGGWRRTRSPAHASRNVSAQHGRSIAPTPLMLA